MTAALITMHFAACWFAGASYWIDLCRSPSPR